MKEAKDNHKSCCLIRFFNRKCSVFIGSPQIRLIRFFNRKNRSFYVSKDAVMKLQAAKRSIIWELLGLTHRSQLPRDHNALKENARKTLVAAYLLDSSSCRAPLKSPSHCSQKRSGKRNRGQHPGVKFKPPLVNSGRKRKMAVKWQKERGNERRKASKKERGSRAWGGRRGVTEGEQRNSGTRQRKQWRF